MSVAAFPLVILFSIGVTGCASHEPLPPAAVPIPCVRLVVAQSVEGRDIELIKIGDGLEVVLILASIHGNECAGTPLVERFADVLAPNGRADVPDDLTVLLIPCANPDGMANRTRQNVHRVDLNRNFPADNYESKRRYGFDPLSEPETKALFEVIQQYRPVYIVTIHQPLTCIDYDGPGYELARMMSQACGLPVKKLGAQPGSLGAWAGETLGIPVITLELPGHAGRLPVDTLWEQYGPALITALTFRPAMTAR